MVLAVDHLNGVPRGVSLLFWVERTLLKMKRISVLAIFILAAAHLSFGNASKQKRHFFNFNRAENAMDVTDFSIYYDVGTNETIRKMMPRPWYNPGWSLRLPFRGGKCECEALSCTCCSGIRLPAFNFDRKTCAIVRFNPEDSMLDLEVKMNDDRVFHKSYAARNPPPFCVAIPVPYLPPGIVDMCIRLFDITVDWQKLHVCMDWDTRIDKAPVVILHFDCMDMGTGVAGGVGLSKPGSSNQPSQSVSSGNQTAVIEPTQVDSDIYDPVTEISSETVQHVSNNTIKYI